jgi:hypothetical protein
VRVVKINQLTDGGMPPTYGSPPWHASEAGEQYMKTISSSIPFGRFSTPDWQPSEVGPALRAGRFNEADS